MGYRRSVVKPYRSRNEEYWKIAFSLKGFRVRLRGFITYQEAMSVACDIRMKILDGSYDPESYFRKKSEQLTFREFYKTHYKSHMNAVLKPSTVSVRVPLIESRLVPYIGSKMIKSIKSSTMERLWSQLRGEGYSEGYISTIWISLRAILKHACDLGFIDSIPDGKKPRVKQRKKKVLSLDQIGSMLRWAQTSNKVEDEITNLLYFLFYTGCRIGEARAVTESDIDFDSMTVRINKRIYAGKLNTTKNDSDLRIPLHRSLLPIIQRQVELRKKYLSTDCESLFISSHSGGPLSRAYIANRIKLIALNALGSSEGVSAHSFRKALASALVSANIPVDEAASMLRNTPSVLLKHYNQADTGQFRDTFNNLTLISSKK